MATRTETREERDARLIRQSDATRPNHLTRELNTPQHAKTPWWGLSDHP